MAGPPPACAIEQDRRRPLPQFLVIGAPRSGTTSVANHLRAHPDVFVPEAKELFFFTGPATPVELDAYRQQFVAARGRVAGEATPLYLADPAAPRRMAAVVPGARLIAVLREPASRAWSHYWHRRTWGRECRSFSQSIDDELSGRPSPSLDGRYIEVGLYHPQIMRVLERYPEEALLVVLFDDLCANPRSVLEGICRHIGVDERGLPESMEAAHNPSYALRSYRLHSLLWRRNLYLRMPRIAALALHRWNERPVPAFDPALRAALRDRFAASNASLSSWLGRPLPW